MLHRHMEPHNPSIWHPLIEKLTRIYLKSLLAAPDKWEAHTKQLFSAIIFEMTYGIVTESCDDPFIQDMTEVTVGFGTAAAPGRFLVDAIPILKYVPSWFPGAGFKRWAAFYKDMEIKARTQPWEHVMKAMKCGTVEPCLATKMAEELPDEGDPRRAAEEERAKWVAGVIHGAGSDTTNSVSMAFFVLLATHPEVQRKAQQELDRVVGKGRLPEFSDREDLVYITAIMKELQRMHIPLLVGFPHATTTDDIYDGYFIPKGTVVLGNTWHIMHDPEIFDEPMKFKLERYIKDGKINPDTVDPGVAVFGYGRRICPGRFLSGESLWLFIACTLSLFDITPPKDGNGEPTIRYKFSQLGLARPEPYDCYLTPRSKEAEQCIHNL
ncbi:cytochrome P450 [Coprinopsis cinerea okayama7|uniref:Cytochrome P450 n=1 Tax=Coprinopsis cinerea (strain Okayama-7 / 130 / ATCC MYA-4618 / FGSC 9003) TaxID=240176 RepID=A8P3S7_COPC7|nr:cytochrome P450 [Coprinopsis cinerea okayama7\|eukprot:XP_001838605.2 cytochrome P450 [Coprinopsis cinerea okayama7\